MNTATAYDTRHCPECDSAYTCHPYYRPRICPRCNSKRMVAGRAHAAAFREASQPSRADQRAKRWLHARWQDIAIAAYQVHAEALIRGCGCALCVALAALARGEEGTP